MGLCLYMKSENCARVKVKCLSIQTVFQAEVKFLAQKFLSDLHLSQWGMKFATQISPLLNYKLGKTIIYNVKRAPQRDWHGCHSPQKSSIKKCLFAQMFHQTWLNNSCVILCSSMPNATFLSKNAFLFNLPTSIKMVSECVI